MPEREIPRILIAAGRGSRPDRVAQRERDEVLPALHTADSDSAWRCECGAVHRVAEDADLVVLAGADVADVECHPNACAVAIVPSDAEPGAAPTRFRRTVVRAGRRGDFERWANAVVFNLISGFCNLGLPPMPCPELLDRLAQPRAYRCEVAWGQGAPPALARRFASGRSAKSVPTSIRWGQIAVRFGRNSTIDAAGAALEVLASLIPGSATTNLIVIPGGGASLVTLLYEE